MAEQAQTVDKFHASLIPALHGKGEQGPGPFRADHLAALEIGRRGQPGIGHRLHPRVFFQPVGHNAGVGDVTLHPQAQRLDPHQRVMRALRVHRHAQIAQADSDGVERERHPAQGPVEVQPVIGRFRL